MRYTTQTDQLRHAMLQGARHFDPLRHTSLIDEAMQEPAGGPWIRCYADFYCERGQWGAPIQYWITLRADGEGRADAINQHIAMLEDDTLPLIHGFAKARFIGFLKP